MVFIFANTQSSGLASLVFAVRALHDTNLRIVLYLCWELQGDEQKRVWPVEREEVFQGKARANIVLHPRVALFLLKRFFVYRKIEMVQDQWPLLRVTGRCLARPLLCLK